MGIVLALLVMGFSGNIAQVLLLRELLVTFYGNELSIGLTLANWLILEAVGSFLVGKMADRIERRVEAFVGLQLLFSLFLPLAVYLTRIAKSLMGVMPGEAVGLASILYASFLILAPISIPHGAQFTFGCRIYSSLAKDEAPSIGKVYIYETLGTIFGGLAFTYLIIPYLHSMQTAIGLAALNFVSGLLLIWPLGKQALRKMIAAALSLLMAFSVYLLSFHGCDRLHIRSIQGQWKGHEVLHYQNSIYGNVMVTKRGEQYTFFSNGIPLITTPVPDITFVEEFVHLSLLSHPAPKDILLVSGGVGGVLTEILKHPVERIDYAELDPLIIELVARYTTPLTEKELASPKVHLKHIDGRLFVRTTPFKYDLVMISFSSPSTIQLNRFFTREFFQVVRRTLREDGILVITSPGSLTYLSEELKDLNICLLSTLEEVYPYIRIIPGDFNLFLASASPAVSAIDAATLTQRLEARHIDTRLLTGFHIEYRLDERWLNWFLDSLQKSEGTRINRDLVPAGLFYDLALWNAQFYPRLRGLIRAIGRVGFWAFAAPLALSALIFAVARAFVPRLRGASIPLAVATTGIAGMAFDLVLILAFQSFYGYVYYQIGLLVTAFMAGAAVGGLWMTRRLDRIEKDSLYLARIESALVLFSAALPIAFLLFQSLIDRPVVFSSLPAIFLVLESAAGLLIGSEFPLASKMHLREIGRIGGVAGALYASDLLGGWLGALVISVVLIPVLGLIETCLLIAMLKLLSLILFATATV